MINVTLRGTEITLLSEKALLWKEGSALFIADLHLGKVSHFRKEGIAVPEPVIEVGLAKLNNTIQGHDVRDIYFLGDLFHSRLNNEWLLFQEVINSFPDVVFHLIIGNHDILDRDLYTQSRLQVYTDVVRLEPFILTHEPLGLGESTLLNLCGHIHPGIVIRGKGRQRFRLPCFFFDEHCIILPAFGTFTGLKTLNVKGNQKAFAIIENKVVEIK